MLSTVGKPGLLTLPRGAVAPSQAAPQGMPFAPDCLAFGVSSGAQEVQMPCEDLLCHLPQ